MALTGLSACALFLNGCASESPSAAGGQSDLLHTVLINPVERVWPSAPPPPAAPAPAQPEPVVIERVEDYGQFPQAVPPEELGAQTGPVQPLPADHPLMREVKAIRGVEWPMLPNDGTSRVYPPQEGVVSFYWQSQKVASGDRFNPHEMTAAHKTLPFGTLVRCTRKDTGKSVVVMINDRGPYVRGRILDISRTAARELNMTRDGVAKCVVEVLAYPMVEAMGPKGNG
jgi:rare lipoprotein A (peptidoglycan hydrolase)